MSKLKIFIILTVSSIVMAAGTHFFRFPDNFNFGGITGLSIVLKKVFTLSPSMLNLIINLLLLILALIFLGKKFLIMTTYTTILSSVAIVAFNYFIPINKPLTDEPVLNLIFAIAIPSIASALLFNISASSGGTDIIAAILNKFLGMNFGTSLLISDLLIVGASFIFFPIKTCLFSVVGLFIKSFAINNIIENFNLCKYFNIICDEPTKICDFITNELHKSATVAKSRGAFSHRNKYVIFTVMTRSQAVKLRNFIKVNDPGAFMMITNSSEIIGKGFLNRY